MQDGKSVIETLSAIETLKEKEKEKEGEKEKERDKDQEKEPEKNPDEQRKKKKIGEQLSFDLPPVSVAEFDLLNRSAFRWINDGHQWLLPVAPGVDAILMPVPDEAGRFMAFAVRKNEKPDLLHPTPLDLGYGQGVCEDYVRRNGGRAFAAKDANWRKIPATPAQIDLLKKLGKLDKCADGMNISKGDASDIIGQFFARKNAKKINRQLSSVG
jgi:hypothetical protein